MMAMLITKAMKKIQDKWDPTQRAQNSLKSSMASTSLTLEIHLTIVMLIAKHQDKKVMAKSTLKWEPRPNQAKYLLH